jgi:hypothetical protein
MALVYLRRDIESKNIAGKSGKSVATRAVNGEGRTPGDDGDGLADFNRVSPTPGSPSQLLFPERQWRGRACCVGKEVIDRPIRILFQKPKFGVS